MEGERGSWDAEGDENKAAAEECPASADANGSKGKKKSRKDSKEEAREKLEAEESMRKERAAVRVMKAFRFDNLDLEADWVKGSSNRAGIEAGGERG